MVKRKVRNISRIIFFTLAGFLLLFQLLAVTLALPAVQNRLVDLIREYASERWEVQIALAQVDVALPAKAVLRGLVVFTPDQEEFVRVEELQMNVLDFDLWNYLFSEAEGQAISLGSLDLIAPEFHLYRHPDSTKNIDFLKSPESTAGEGEEEAKQLAVNISNLHIERGLFTYRDATSDAMDSIFVGHVNFARITLEDISGDFSFHSRPSGSLEWSTSNLRFREAHSGFVLSQLSAEILTASIRVTDPESPYPRVSILEFRDMFLEVFDTRIAADVRFVSRDLTTLLDRVPDEQFDILLKPSQVDFLTLGYFFRKPLPLVGKMDIKGNFSGTWESLRSNSLTINYGKHTQLQGQMALRDYVNPDSLLMNLQFDESAFSFAELQQLLPGVPFPAALVQAAPMQLKGTFLGSYYDFQTKATLLTQAGDLDWNLHLMLPPHFPELAYEGNLETLSLNPDELGLFTRSFSDQLNFRGRIKGTGTELLKMQTAVSGNLSDSHLMGYSVDSLALTANVEAGTLAGQFYLFDPKGYAQLNGRANLAAEIPDYHIDGSVEGLDLKAFGLYDRLPLAVSGHIRGDFSGDSLEQASGEVAFREICLLNKETRDQMDIPRIWMHSDGNTRAQKYINIKSSLLDADISGAFTFARVGPVISELLYESRLFFTNSDSLIEAHYASKVVDTTELAIQFALAPKDTSNQLLDFLGYPLSFSSGALVSGNIEAGLFQRAEIRADFDAVRYDKWGLGGTHFDMELIKASERNMVITAGGMQVDSFFQGSRLILENVALELGNISGSDNTIQLDILADQLAAANRLQLILKVNLLEEGGLVAAFEDRDSYIKVKEDTLRIRENNQMRYQADELAIEGLRIENGERYLALQGVVSKDPASVLMMQLHQVRLELLDKLYPLPYKLSGLLNARIRLQNLLDRPVMVANSRIADFGVDDFAYGDIFGDANWNPDQEKLQLDARLLGEEKDTTLRLEGFYLASDTIAPLHFQVSTENSFPLNYIYPFVKTQLFGIQGKVDLRSFRVGGSFKDLIVEGEGQFVDAGFGVAYFQTEYRFNGVIEFDKDRIVFPQRSPIRLYDKNGNHADFYGLIRHRGMREFEFDLQLDRVQDFLVMDTEKGENELFYGTLKVKAGVASIAGNLQKLDIEAFAMTGEGTSLKIPITDENRYSRPEFIRFTGEDAAKGGPVNTGLQGFDIRLNVLATEEAEIELIFDEKVGDIIQGRGNGNFSLFINQEGEFSMSGEYEIARGNYLFTSQNILNKKFSVKRGGTIQWTGDPYGALLNLEAVYSLNADIKDLVRLDRSVRVPVNVVMHMGGSLEKPEIIPGVELPNLNDQEAIRVISALKAVQYDEQELNKQVFSLMVFNRFAPVGGFLGSDPASNTGVVSTSISELFTNQLNYWLSRAMSDKLSVAVGTNNLQDVNLLISAKLFNDRVTIERDGTLVNSESGVTLGNISVMVKLLPGPGKSGAFNRRPSELVLEVFNRENLDLQYNSTNQTGIGVFYKKDFDNLRDLIKGHKE